MRFSISRANLTRVIGAVSKVVESRNTIPVLSHLLLSADGKQLRVTGTDLDITATAGTEADVQASGTVCVDAKLLGSIAAKAGADSVELSLEGDKLTVKSGRSRFSLATLPAVDFPDLGGGTFTAEFELDLASLFAPVAFAISSDDVRYYLQGIFLHSHEGKLTAVATDGHRLAAQSTESGVTIPDIIVPKKTVGLLPKGSVKVSVSDTKIRVVSGDFVMTSKLIDGTFPDYRRVIPSANDKVVTFDRDALLHASDRVATISSERGRAVKFSIAPGGISLSVRSDVGDAADEIAADYTGEPVDIGFNAGYVRDMLSVLPTGEVSFALADGGSPALVKSTSVENWTGVCMPMRV
ncbi:hypothetical protein HAAEEKHM_00074 [Sinorhizobium phage AP-16-3]|nr:hypothetical protein HAAEEKHM_00074 [Sinorhizobium phage AP-16-3]